MISRALAFRFWFDTPLFDMSASEPGSQNIAAGNSRACYAVEVEQTANFTFRFSSASTGTKQDG
jgi:hypothetical protein